MAMVCPKCGKDSPGAKFCPECGQDLHAQPVESKEDRRRRLRASKQAYCPYCLSTDVEIDPNPWLGSGSHAHAPLAVIVDAVGNMMLRVLYHKHGKKCICKNCGAEWHVKRAARHERYERHVEKILGEYRTMRFPGINGSSLILGWYQLTIVSADGARTEIQYEKLAAVEHRPCVGVMYGRLSVRDKAHRWKPYPKTWEATKKDKLTLLYANEHLHGYLNAYEALRAIVAENKKERIV